MSKLPKVLYVYRGKFEDGSAEWWAAEESKDDCVAVGERVRVGTYQLASVETVSATKMLHEKKGPKR